MPDKSVSMSHRGQGLKFSEALQAVSSTAAHASRATMDYDRDVQAAQQALAMYQLNHFYTQKRCRVMGHSGMASHTAGGNSRGLSFRLKKRDRSAALGLEMIKASIYMISVAAQCQSLCHMMLG